MFRFYDDFDRWDVGKVAKVSVGRDGVEEYEVVFLCTFLWIYDDTFCVGSERMKKAI